MLDADGLNAINGQEELLKRRKAVTVLTPHEGEFLRLGGDLSKGREAAAAAFSEKYGVYLVLKGHRTVVAAPDRRVAVNSTGNSGMATAGSGDVLTGIITALLARGYDQRDACAIGMYLHGLAGDIAAKELGKESLIASDIINYLPKAFKRLE